ncbi:hypothetical protein SESBI_04119, partial [Sesbania bispinosa]
MGPLALRCNFMPWTKHRITISSRKYKTWSCCSSKKKKKGHCILTTVNLGMPFSLDGGESHYDFDVETLGRGRCSLTIVTPDHVDLIGRRRKPP